MSHTVGETVILDGIESIIVYDAGSEQFWGRYLCVDKNHDLVWYFTNDDYVDESLPIENSKYGYEWGGYGISTDVSNSDIGLGLGNTDYLISQNIPPTTEGWFVIWDKVREFRTQINSEEWFVPSGDELDEVVSHQSLLENLSTFEGISAYWSSTELNKNSAKIIEVNSLGGVPDLNMNYKNRQDRRVRLCRYATDEELKQVTITCATEGASIYYTYNNSDPTETSFPYSQPLNACNIQLKARAFLSGITQSDVASKLIEGGSVLERLPTPQGNSKFNLAGGTAELSNIDEYPEDTVFHLIDDGTEVSGTKLELDTTYAPGPDFAIYATCDGYLASKVNYFKLPT